MTQTLSLQEARRVALAAQGFGGRRRGTPATWPRIEAVVGRLGLLQIDSVNVLARAHELPAFSRLGPYDRRAFGDRAFGPRRRALFEYWAHEASLLPLTLHPYLRWRMAQAAAGRGVYGRLVRFARERPEAVAEALAEVRDRGPITARELKGPTARTSPWWGWHDGKVALEWLFWTGGVTAAGRQGFERRYDLPERALPSDVLALPTPSEDEAIRHLVRVAARALGVATEPDLRDYFRLDPAPSKRAVAELAEAGDLVPVRVEGWERPAWLDPAARWPRRIGGGALLSPFDPMVWARGRAERLFGFRYRLEIYTPAPKRVFGYYVLPYLLDERLVARVDLKADRRAGLLRVCAAHAEPGADHGAVAEALAADLRRMADWLGLGGVAVEGRGDLAPALRAAGPASG